MMFKTEDTIEPKSTIVVFVEDGKMQELPTDLETKKKINVVHVTGACEVIIRDYGDDEIDIEIRPKR